MSSAPLVSERQPVRPARVGVLALAGKYRRLTLAALFVALLFVVALVAPILSPHDPLAGYPDSPYLPPLSPGHFLGTDELGRDLLSRVLSVTLVSLPVAFGAGAGVLFSSDNISRCCGSARVPPDPAVIPQIHSPPSL